MCFRCYYGLQDEKDDAVVKEGDDAPFSLSTPYEITVGDTFEGELSSGGDADVVKIDLIQGESYVFEMEGLPGEDLDAFFFLIDGDGYSVAYDDSFGAENNSLVIFTAEYTGTYYILAESAYLADMMDYQVSVDLFDSSSHDIPEATIEELAEYLTDGYWEDTGRSRHSFDTSSDNEITVDLTGLTADGKQLARWALESWEMVADIEFVEVSSGADIEFTDDDPDGAYSYYFASGGTTTSAVVNVPTEWLEADGTTMDSYSFQTYIHEIGHALGLGHQGNYNGSGSFLEDALFQNDSWQMSVMSYFSQTENPYTNASWAPIASTMWADIVAIQDLYGAADGGATAGNTVYGANSNLDNYLGDLFDAIENGNSSTYWNGVPVTFTIFDEGGVDTLDLTLFSGNQNVDLRPGQISDVGGRTGNLIIAGGTLIENVTTGNGDDTIQANGKSNVIRSGSGGDTISAGTGFDTVYAGSGNDEIKGFDGYDTIYGEDGDDVIFGNNGFDTLFGGDGNDRIEGGNSPDTISGGNGNDTLSGNAGADTLEGDAGNDTLNGNAGTDFLYGGSGDDTLNGGINHDYLEGGAGNDSLNGNNGFDTLLGGTGNDIMKGNGGDDILDGQAGDDILNGGIGADIFIFNEGSDRIIDFVDNVDSIQLDADALGISDLQPADVGDLAQVVDGNLIMDFGNGNVLRVNGVTDFSVIEDELTFV